MIVFDMDGVLVDSRETILLAYRRAGVVAPDNILEQEATGWLEAMVGGVAPAQAIRDQKNREYVNLLRNSDTALLPPFATATQLYHEGHVVGLMTGAPKGSAQALREYCAEQRWGWPFARAVEGRSTERKMQWLAQVGGHGVYVDDQDRLVNVPEGWRFLKYDQQDAQTLYEEITACVCV